MSTPTAPAEPTLVEAGPAFVATGLVHRVLRPDGPGPFLTMVLLHGQGGDEDVMWIFARSLPVGTLVIAPRAPIPEPAQGGYTWVQRAADDWPTLDRFEGAVAVLARFIAALPDLYGADPARIGVMGFSQGAATAFAMAIARPGMLAAVASLVGFVPEGALSGGGQALAGLPVLMLVGNRDELVPLVRARASAAVLRGGGAALTYGEYDVGHKVSTAGQRALAAWWAEHLR
jgi:phospholipase/carboxylesterase